MEFELGVEVCAAHRLVLGGNCLLFGGVTLRLKGLISLICMFYLYCFKQSCELEYAFYNLCCDAVV